MGPTLQGIRIPCLSYSDDLALMGESIEELKEMLEKLEKFCDVNKLKINTAKTKILIFRKGKHPEAAKFAINGNDIEIVSRFRYLGVVLRHS